MTIRLDAQLSPLLGSWISEQFDVICMPLRDLGLRDAKDELIFFEARTAQAVVMTKDRDFVELLYRFGPPPKVIWLTCGNTSNSALQTIFQSRLSLALKMLESGDSLVEIQ